MTQVREFLASKKSDAEYQLTKSLEQLPPTGAGVLTWKGCPVSMVCFDLGQKQVLYLFVVNRSAVPDGPKEEPAVIQVNRLATASWSSGDKTYLLACERDLNFVRSLANN
jgi:hypothetical protein